jgi:hypothetical protein
MQDKPLQHCSAVGMNTMQANFFPFKMLEGSERNIFGLVVILAQKERITIVDIFKHESLEEGYKVNLYLR